MEDITEDLTKSEGAVEALMPSTSARVLRFSLVNDQGVMQPYEFTQATLGFVPIQKFFNQVRREIQNFVKGEYGIKLGELFRGEVSMPAASELVSSDVDKVIEDNQAVIDVIFKLIEIAPDFQLDVIALSLGVQTSRVEWFKGAISEPPHRGGLTVSEGFDILKTFIRQNASEIRGFFEEEATSLAKEFRLAVGMEDEESASESSTGGTPSSTTSQATQVSA
jgi:hypothetical protein